MGFLAKGRQTAKLSVAKPSKDSSSAGSCAVAAALGRASGRHCATSTSGAPKLPVSTEPKADLPKANLNHTKNHYGTVIIPAVLKHYGTVNYSDSLKTLWYCNYSYSLKTLWYCNYSYSLKTLRYCNSSGSYSL